MSPRSRAAAIVAGLVAVTLLASCRESPPPATDGSRRGAEVVVASFNFPESAVLAEIYARAIEAAGIPVRREIDLGTRELVQPALLGGLVDVVPEYLGTALASLQPSDGAPTDSGEARQRLAGALDRRGIRVLDAAPAQNQNGVVVSRDTAERYRLDSVSDLAAIAAGMVLGGPPECPQRPYCGEGLGRVYGLHFERFVPLESEQQRAAALTDGLVDVAVMFTTDGRLATGDLVLLEDDRRLQPSENVVPLVAARSLERYGVRLADTINAVSARLTTNNLRFLNWRISIAERDVATEARGWLERQSLVRPPF
ncbi:MAG TPA: ABC transporter substrate-binding protein [Acidimicrobiales bacterium]|nr:ABC transporter substrate-binding protein [Acidimicrobiales bacterium]